MSEPHLQCGLRKRGYGVSLTRSRIFKAEREQMTSTNQSTHVRPVRSNDREEWLRLRDCLWPGSPDDHAQDIDGYFSRLQDGVTLVMEGADGELCGFIEVGLRSYAEGCVSSPVPYIEGWYVDEAMRRRKLGSRLLQAAEQWARDRRFGEIGSDAQWDNEASIQAHKAHGYEEVVRAVCLRKTLEP